MTEVSKNNEKESEIIKFRRLFPGSIKVHVTRSENGVFCAEVVSYPGVITQGNTFSELIEMVNDAMLTYFEVPEEFASFMPNYMPPLNLARELGVFPVKQISKDVEMKLPEYENSEY